MNIYYLIILFIYLNYVNVDVYIYSTKNVDMGIVDLSQWFLYTVYRFFADNVDHSIRILDGLNTFHGIGVIACTTPSNENTWIIPK